MASRERKFANDDPRHGATTQPAVLLLIIGLVEVVTWVYCNFQQITTTHDSILGILIATTSASTPSASASQVVTFLVGNMDKANKIAYTIAYATQVVFLMAAFPISRVWSQMHIKQSHATSGSGWRAHVSEIKNHLTIRRVVFIIFFIGDVWSDLRYVSLTSHDYLIPILYILGLAVGSTIVGLDGWQRLSGFVMSVLNTLHNSTAQAQPQRD